jgi:hypothetical protein
MSEAELENEEVGLLVEQEACNRWRLDHDANNGDDPRHYDATATTDTPVTGIGDGDLVEVKGCAEWISDGSARRRGRWWFSKSNHDALLEEGGYYALGVYDSDEVEVHRVVLINARAVDGILTDRWSTCGKRHHSDESAQLPWPEVLHSGLDLEVGD